MSLLPSISLPAPFERFAELFPLKQVFRNHQTILLNYDKQRFDETIYPMGQRTPSKSSRRGHYIYFSFGSRPRRVLITRRVA
jgi:hypothetical protein